MIKRLKGFTLIEMMMVLVIVSGLIVMLANYSQMKTAQIVRDRAAIQIAQIDNAGLSYYLNNANWPNYTSGTGCTTAGLSTLQTGTYLPPSIKSPFIGLSNYVVSCTTNGQLLMVTLNTRTNQDATIIAGMVPGGVATTGTLPSVTSYVNIPGQNLNNARSVNAAGVYHNGACVPVPVCPTGMTPQIYVGIAQIMGTNDAAATNPNLYPITNFTAYATGGTSTTPAVCTGGGTSACNNYGPSESTTPKTSPTNVNYWRVCVDVGTQAGDIPSNASGTGGTGTSSWGQYQSLLAITRCAVGNPITENSGSDLFVWAP
jgi:prepilin-type N-terminal cleavage/methylation domain-containing protein